MDFGQIPIRFSKQNLLLDAYQTPDVEHEELWWQLCMIAYTQLYLGKDSIANSVQPWERYLPEYKTATDKIKATITPSQAQRGFADLLKVIGTPAKPSVARGKTSGRQVGTAQVKRELKQIIFKFQKDARQNTESIVEDSESAPDISNPQRILSFINLVQASLKKLNISAAEFTNLLLNTT